MQNPDILYAIDFLKKGFVFRGKGGDEYYRYDKELQQFVYYTEGFDRSSQDSYAYTNWSCGEQEFMERMSKEKEDLFYYEIGRCFLHEGFVHYYNKAMLEAEKAFLLAKDYASKASHFFYYNIDLAFALIYLHKGDIAQAKTLIRKASEEFSPLIWHAVSSVFGYKSKDQEHLEKIIATCSLLLQADPENWELWYEMASHLFSLERFAESEQALQEAERFCTKSEAYKELTVNRLRKLLDQKKA